MRASIGWAQPRRVVHAMGLGEQSKLLAPQGEPLETFWSAALERPNAHLRAKGGGADTLIEAQRNQQRAKKKSGFGSQGGTPGKILVAGVGKASPPHARLQA